MNGHLVAMNGARPCRATDAPGAAYLERIPPQNIEAEQSVLGAMLLGDPRGLDAAGDLLTKDDFYREAHGHIFEAMLHLHGKAEPVDAVTLKAELVRRGVYDLFGGASYIMALGDVTPTTAHIAHYARIVRRLATLRRLITAGAEITGRAYAAEVEDADEIADTAERLILDASGTTRQDTLRPARPIISEVMDAIDARRRRGDRITGVETYFAMLDYYTAGLQPSDLILIAGRPGMGKTSMAADIARNTALRGEKRVAFFSLEMTGEQIIERMICAEAGVDSHRVRTGLLSDEEYMRLHEASQRLWDGRIWVDDRSDTTPAGVRSKCRRLKAEQGLDLVIVDYLQYMRADSFQSRESLNVAITEIVQGLKSVAKELKVPVIALSQLSRAVERREDKRPMLSDLRDSGGLEAEADLILFPYRPDYYKRREEGEEAPAMEEAEVIVAKQRKGPTGKFKVAFHPSFARFDNLAEGGF